MGNEIMFALTIMSNISVFIMAYIILRVKKKSQIQIIFLCIVATLFFWNTGTLLEMSFRTLYGYTEMFFVNISYIGICYIPPFTLLLGIVFARTKIGFTWKYYLLFVIPTVSIVVVWTNKLHNLFFVNYSVYSRDAVYGYYYYFHSLYSYVCIFIGIIYLIFFSTKNSGFFSRQSILTLVGIIIPLTFNILYSFNLADLTFNVNSTAFTISMICFIVAIYRYKFLSVLPIARQRVVALISDSYLVIDDELDIIDYNETLVDTFKGVMKFSREGGIRDLVKRNPKVDFGIDKILETNGRAIKNRCTLSFEHHMVAGDFDRHFKVEITPILSRDKVLGSIILLKDVTQNVRDLETIKENQTILLEQERLASLGQLIGGIAHNLKTPIMSIAGGIEALKDLAYEYRDSIDDESVTISDHQEIAKEMLSWLDKMKPYCAYMSDVISAVKGQAVQMNASSMVKFTVDELVKRVDLLMKHELKKYHCTLNIDPQIDMNTEIKGEVNNLVQVFDNIIINAMQAYEGKIGTIDLRIVRSGDNIEFTFRDYAGGIPKQVSDRLFREMVTTKGRNGTGLGLYMSYSTVRGRFGGNMSFSSKEGNGTTFFISIPCISRRTLEVDI